MLDSVLSRSRKIASLARQSGVFSAVWLRILAAGFSSAIALAPLQVLAQVPPSDSEIRAYQGLHAAAARGDLVETRRLLAAAPDLKAVDSHTRTALHVAAHRGARDIAEALVAAGADPNALDSRRYDIITIAAVRDDEAFVDLAVKLGGNAKAITSPYLGTALIAAAHLGHDGVVRRLIAAGAPLDHVNNLKWTALIEAIVLGDGGARHQACVKALLAAGANPNLADGNGASPLALARSRGYSAMEKMIADAGGR